MSLARSATRTIATLAIAGICSLSLAGSAEAGWGHLWGHHWGLHHHRHVHHWGHGWWPSYHSFGYYGGFHSWYPYHYRVASYSYSPYYVRPYYVSPYYASPYYVTPQYVSPCYVTPTIDLGCCASWVGEDAVQTTMEDFGPSALAVNDKIELQVEVPEGARIIINDQPTSTTGSERTFLSRSVPQQDRYEFVVRAEVDRDGQTITETKRVLLQGGQSSKLSFNFDPPAAAVASVEEPVTTALRVRVPEGARVYLAGYETQQTGEVRVFETNQLQAGEELQDYTVRVVLDEGGTTHSREEELTLVGGQIQELDFDFSAEDRIASR
jgi:uncharacterized protein (TIGR03000 family)